LKNFCFRFRLVTLLLLLILGAVITVRVAENFYHVLIENAIPALFALNTVVVVAVGAVVF